MPVKINKRKINVSATAIGLSWPTLCLALSPSTVATPAKTFVARIAESNGPPRRRDPVISRSDDDDVYGFSGSWESIIESSFSRRRTDSSQNTIRNTTPMVGVAVSEAEPA